MTPYYRPFGLERDPFLDTADPHFYRITPALLRVRDRLTGGVLESRGLQVVVGDPGTGKTSLMAMLGRDSYSLGATVLYGRCDEETLVPYQPFVEAFAHYAEVRAAEQLDAELGRHRAELARLVPRLEAEAAGFGMASEEAQEVFPAALAYLGINSSKPAVKFEIRLPKATALVVARDSQVELRRVM